MEYGVDELYNVGFRTLTLQRLLLLVGGPDVVWIPEIHDDNPERFYEPLPTGPFKGLAPDRAKVRSELKQYYLELG